MKADRTPIGAENSGPRARTFAWGVRARIVVGYVALLAAALAISVLVTRQMLLTRLDNDIEILLAQEVEELRVLAGGNDPETGEPFGNDVEAIFSTFFNRNIPSENEAYYALVDDELVLRTFNAPDLTDDTRLTAAWAAADQPTRGTVSTTAGEMTFLAAPLSEADGATLGTFVVAYFPETDRAEITQIVRIILLAGATVLIVTGSLAWTLAGRVLRPARELTRTARNITESDLSLRIPVSGNDELAELGTTFNEMLDRLEAGFEGQRQFLDDVAHELRTPITIVSGHVELLGDDPGERAESQAIITDELGRMSRYVDDLLLLAKAEHGAFLRFEPFDLGEFMDGLMQRVGSIGQRRWVVDASPRLGTVVMVADEARVMQAVLNLASNSVQHTSEGAEIGIGAERSTMGDVESVRCWVRDTGPGIDTENLDKLFRRQFRGVASRAARTEGMGLGLSIVDAIARAHGGTASASNEPDGGARFVIEIPVEPPDELPNQENLP